MARGGSQSRHQSIRTRVLVISRLVLLAPQLLVPEPLLPALVEGLSLIHSVPVAKVSAVPVVAEVSVLVSKVSAASTPLLELSWMSSVPSTVHVGSAPSAHVPSVHWTSSVHGSSSGSHVAPHRPPSGGSAQAGEGAAPVEVAPLRESSSEGRRRQEATRRTVESSTRSRSSSEVPSVLESSPSSSSLSRSSSTTKLVLPSPASSSQASSPLGRGAALVGLLLSR